MLEELDYTSKEYKRKITQERAMQELCNTMKRPNLPTIGIDEGEEF